MAKKVLNKRSVEVIENQPKLPTSAQTEYGEIAINYAAGHETISIRNNNDEIATFAHGNAIVFAGICNTSGETSAKVVDCSTFRSADLVKGVTIFVTFAETNSAATDAMTLNVNSTGAKPIKKVGKDGISDLADSSLLYANQTYMFQYDGTNWVCMASDSPSAITDIEDYHNLSQSGSLLDGYLVKTIIEDDEEITASALNNLNDRVNTLSAETVNYALKSDIPEVPPMIDTVSDFSGLTESGYVIEGLVLKKVIEDNELITSSAINDLNSRTNTLSGTARNLRFDVSGLDARVTILEGTPGLSYITINNNEHSVQQSGTDNYVNLGSGYITSGEVITTLPAFSAVTQTGSVVDAYVIKQVVEEINNLIPITYSELKSLRDNSLLVPGTLYRITDYITTVKSTYTATRSAEHPFDVIVEAISENTLNEEAQACLHDGDTYFSGVNFDAWKIWYALDNDSDRFDWANSGTGKGVIYRMIDEWDNDVPYDFKNIQYKRYKVTAKAANPELASLNGLYIGLPNNYSKGLDCDTSDFKWFYTFSKLGNTWNDNITDESINGAGASDTHYALPNNYPDEPMPLNNIVNANGPVIQNFLLSLNPNPTYQWPDEVSISVHLDVKARYLSLFGANSYNYAFGPFRRNTIVGIHRHENYKTDCQDNTIASFDDNAFNTWGDAFNNNIMISYWIISNNFADTYVSGNVFYNTSTTNGISNNVFQSRVYNNKFYGYAISNVFRGINTNDFGLSGSQISINNCEIVGNFHHNTISATLSNVKFSQQFSYSTIADDLKSCSFDGVCSYLNIPSDSGQSVFAGIDVVGPLRGSSGNNIVLDAPEFYITGIANTTRRIKVEGETGGTIVATWMEDEKRVGIYKASGSNTWLSLPSASEIQQIVINESATTISAGTVNLGNYIPMAKEFTIAGAFNDLNDRMLEYETEVFDLQATISGLQSTISGLQSTISGLTARIEALEG